MDEADNIVDLLCIQLRVFKNESDLSQLDNAINIYQLVNYFICELPTTNKQVTVQTKSFLQNFMEAFSKKCFKSLNLMFYLTQTNCGKTFCTGICSKTNVFLATVKQLPAKWWHLYNLIV